MVAHCHKMIAEAAREICAASYGEFMSDNYLRRCWQSQTPDMTEAQREAAFIARKWGRYVPVARAMLAHSLTTHTDEAIKEEIMEALCRDATLRRGRRTPKTLIGAF